MQNQNKEKINLLMTIEHIYIGILSSFLRGDEKGLILISIYKNESTYRVCCDPWQQVNGANFLKRSGERKNFISYFLIKYTKNSTFNLFTHSLLPHREYCYFTVLVYLI